MYGTAAVKLCDWGEAWFDGKGAGDITTPIIKPLAAWQGGKKNRRWDLHAAFCSIYIVYNNRFPFGRRSEDIIKALESGRLPPETTVLPTELQSAMVVRIPVLVCHLEHLRSLFFVLAALVKLDGRHCRGP